MSIYPAFRSLLFKLDPETAHEVSTSAGRFAAQVPGLRGLIGSLFTLDSEALQLELFGQRFRNPIGLAAGFDKHAALVDLLQMLGFGFVEVGSLSAKPAPGNPKPRLFRLPEDHALINRMGLNNPGAAAGLNNLTRQRLEIPCGINIAKTHDPAILGEAGFADVVESYRLACGRGTYTAINVSCPNTREGKTFEEPEALGELLGRIKQHRVQTPGTVPLLLKLSSDSSIADLEQAVETAEQYEVDGYILCNTTTSREGLASAPQRLAEIGMGGLSGPLLTDKAVPRVQAVFRLLGGKKPIIGVGGIDSAESAYRFIRAGASLVQVYTSLIYQGPMLVKNISRGLVELLERDGIDNVRDAVGLDS